MFLLSILGVVRTILIVIAVFVILRFIGRIMVAKRNLAEENQLQAKKDAYKKAKELSKRKEGKIHIVKGKLEAEDVDYEELK